MQNSRQLLSCEICATKSNAIINVCFCTNQNLFPKYEHPFQQLGTAPATDQNHSAETIHLSVHKKAKYQRKVESGNSQQMLIRIHVFLNFQFRQETNKKNKPLFSSPQKLCQRESVQKYNISATVVSLWRKSNDAIMSRSRGVLPETTTGFVELRFCPVSKGGRMWFGRGGRSYFYRYCNGRNFMGTISRCG